MKTSEQDVDHSVFGGNKLSIVKRRDGCGRESPGRMERAQTLSLDLGLDRGYCHLQACDLGLSVSLPEEQA